MKFLLRFFCLIAAGITGLSEVRAQLSIPLANVTLAYPGIDPVTLTLNGSTRYGRPTPLIITGASLSLTSGWYCLDPLQTMFFSPTPEPAGNSLLFGSTNPNNFDQWGSAAPGLTAGRIQKLADLFHAYAPNGAAASSLIAGALQLAIWEIANEPTGTSLSVGGSGYFTVTANGSSSAASMIALANSMLSSLTTTGIKNTGNTTALHFLIDGSYQRNGSSTVTLVQDLVGYGPLLPIPESTTYALGATGVLFGLVLHRRFKRPAASRAT